MRGECRGNSALGDCRVGRDVADFIDCDRGVAFERGFQLLGEGCGLRADAGGEGFHHAGERGLRHLGRKMNAGDACGGEEAREAFFRGSGFQGDAVEEQLIAGNGEQQDLLRRHGRERFSARSRRSRTALSFADG